MVYINNGLTSLPHLDMKGEYWNDINVSYMGLLFEVRF